MRVMCADLQSPIRPVLLNQNPSSPEYRLITRRRVIYVSGYDPQGPQGYYALFGSQLKRACALWHSKFVLGPLVIESADIASWTVTMGGPNWQVFTLYAKKILSMLIVPNLSLDKFPVPSDGCWMIS